MTFWGQVVNDQLVPLEACQLDVNGIYKRKVGLVHLHKCPCNLRTKDRSHDPMESARNVARDCHFHY